MSVLITLCLAAPVPQDVLVARGDTWRYLDDGSDQGSAWVEPAFDDSTWATGQAVFGFGTTGLSTEIDVGGDPTNRPITTYFRTSFDVPDPSVYVALELRMRRDDGAIAYLGGAELVRANLPDGPVAFDTRAVRRTAGGAATSYFPDYERPFDLVTGANALAVELHQISPSTVDAAFDLELVGHRGPSVIRGPYVQMSSESEVTIRYRTIVPTDSRLWYGTAPGALTNVLSSPASTTEHELRISGLTSQTTYFYAVGDSSGVLAGGDPDHRFHTAPTPGTRAPLRIWALGDAGTYSDDQRRVRDAFLAVADRRSADLMLFLGDNAYRIGTDQEYQLAVFDTYGDALQTTPAFSTRGNHELIEDVYFDAFTLPDQAQLGGIASGVEDYYSFDWANVHFVCLDSWASDKSRSGPMYLWCKADLEATKQDWIVAFFHHPPYSKGSHDSDLETELEKMRSIFGPLLENYGVALVLSGHSHAYERSYLLDRHYGKSPSFDVETHAVDAGLGRESLGVGAYRRSPGPNGGTVYVVSGSAGQVSSNGTLQHPAMVWSQRSLGSVMIDVVGGRMDVSFYDDAGAKRDYFTLIDSTWTGSFCTGSVNGEGCVATMSTSGVPSVSSGQPFVVRAAQVRTNATSLMFYGAELTDLPFQGGRLCVGASLFRTQIASSGGSTPCSGHREIDFATLWGSPSHPLLAPGSTIYCQTWYRDTTAFGSSVSEAVAFTVVP